MILLAHFCEQVEALVSEQTMERLREQVLELQHALAETSREWQLQVETLEARDRLCVQEVCACVCPSACLSALFARVRALYTECRVYIRIRDIEISNDTHAAHAAHAAHMA